MLGLIWGNEEFKREATSCSTRGVIVRGAWMDTPSGLHFLLSEGCDIGDVVRDRNFFGSEDDSQLGSWL